MFLIVSYQEKMTQRVKQKSQQDKTTIATLSP
jgi:hypothetical protein